MFALVMVAVAFALMGATALIAPNLVTRQFGIPDLSAEGRNEVRAVYGGFGIAMSAMLILALGAPSLTGAV